MKMSDENDAGAAYLAALKRSTAPQAAGAAPARAPEVPRSAESRTGVVAPPGKTNFTGTEKRKSPRYQCQGSARLQEIGSTVATWATFTDISMSGCYMEAAATYRAGATLGLRLEANGFRVEATGEVRVAYPQLGMGICFTKISDADRERLRGLLRAISPSSVILSSRPAPHAPSIQQSDAMPPVTDPAVALQAMRNFFEDRHIMGREEFLRILRKSQ
jgi:PilZ domain